MMTSTFQDKRLSRLGFGAMRLPLSDAKKSAMIDEAVVNDMVRYAQEHGVNYYDTAYPYHDGQSELVLGRILKQFPRDSYYLATKYPGHQISSIYDPREVFEKQLEKCGVDYFDFYLLHNVYENSIHTYTDPRWGIVDYFLEQKKTGRIRHLGFSCHGGIDILKQFLDKYGDIMEFCQIQINYLDWTLQNAKAKYDLLAGRNIPVWAMEPVRGGKLAALPEMEEKKLKALRPEESIAAWGFRWVQSLPNIKMILSGMSKMEQMKDNVKTFSNDNPLSAVEIELLYEIAQAMKNSIPCTACRYCCDSCPQGLDIPSLLDLYNQLRFSPDINIGMRMEAISQEKQPDACITCGSCSKVCPQNIDIPAAMKDLSVILSKIPKWAEISRRRDAVAQNENTSICGK